VNGHVGTFRNGSLALVPPAPRTAPKHRHRSGKTVRPSKDGLGALLALVLLFAAGTGFAEPAFESPPGRDSAGFFSLSWSGAERFELERATGPDHADARIIYRGSDTTTTVSGLPDGEYRFRIRAEGSSAWSDEAVVVVEHHALSRALLFFALGAGVFLALVLAIARGRKLA
jgi:hypothetical protein